jgi:ribosome assembly protein YihI (activator of Der GTPase)
LKSTIIHITPGSSKDDLWAELERKNVLIRELESVIEAHAKTIQDKQAVIDAATKRIDELMNKFATGGEVHLRHNGRFVWAKREPTKN